MTGHQQIPADLGDRLRRVLKAHDGAPHDGVCCVADGADQAFAEEILRAGGRLEVIVPCASYDETFERAEARVNSARLIALASEVVRLPFPQPSEEAFLAAGLIVAERCDLLLAAWDGRPARGLGGTADVVAYAGTIGRPVQVLQITRPAPSP